MCVSCTAFVSFDKQVVAVKTWCSQRRREKTRARARPSQPPSRDRFRTWGAEGQRQRGDRRAGVFPPRPIHVVLTRVYSLLAPPPFDDKPRCDESSSRVPPPTL